MALKDMKLTAEEAKDQGYCCEPEADDKGPKYPWGLQITLGDETLAKLGIGIMPVGTEVMIMARATITGASSRERVGGEKHEDMDVQITGLEISSVQADRMGRSADRLYPNKDK